MQLPAAVELTQLDTGGVEHMLELLVLLERFQAQGVNMSSIFEPQEMEEAGEVRRWDCFDTMSGGKRQLSILMQEVDLTLVTVTPEFGHVTPMDSIWQE